ncbi:MAG: SDR family oxidoreductase [Verrucomicrobiota bacterium]|nr:SDR family oxidoreductase [Verrucomicrobiota bacterium]
MSPRIILITGANGGLGQAIARTFLDESPENFIWLGLHAGREAAEKLAQQYPDRCRTLDLDVTQSAAWQKAVTQILSEHQRVDVLVNNAGKHDDGLLATLSGEAWRNVLAANLDATFHGCQAVLPTMISQRSGRIINVASLSALLAPAGQTNYAAAKAGVVALTQSLAKEIARIGITVNVVCPGYIETEALIAMNPEEKKIATSKIPMRRFGRPEEIAAAIRFLACPEASYITGSILKIDGGIL